MEEFETVLQARSRQIMGEPRDMLVWNIKVETQSHLYLFNKLSQEYIKDNGFLDCTHISSHYYSTIHYTLAILTYVMQAFIYLFLGFASYISSIPLLEPLGWNTPENQSATGTIWRREFLQPLDGSAFRDNGGMYAAQVAVPFWLFAKIGNHATYSLTSHRNESLTRFNRKPVTPSLR